MGVTTSIAAEESSQIYSPIKPYILFITTTATTIAINIITYRANAIPFSSLKARSPMSIYTPFLGFILGHLTGQIPLPFQVLGAFIIICIMSTLKTEFTNMPSVDAHQGADPEAIAEIIISGVLNDSNVASAEPIENQKQGEEKHIWNRDHQQCEQSTQTVMGCEDFIMQPYKHISSPPPPPPPPPPQQPPSLEAETESRLEDEAETPPLLSVSTSSSASTVDLTAPCSGAVTGTTGVTGNTTPARSVVLGRASDPKSLRIRRALEEMSKLNEVDGQLHRSESAESALDMEQQQQNSQEHTTQDGSPGKAGSVDRVMLQAALGARLVGVSTEDVLAEAHLQSPHALAADSQRQSSSSSWQGSDDELQNSMGPETEFVVDTAITTPGPDTEQEQRRIIINNDDKVINNNDGHKVINMPELLKTSNRLLEDGRRLLAGGKRRPRQVCGPVSDVWLDKPSHERAEGLLRVPSNRQGWYAHDLLE